MDFVELLLPLGERMLLIWFFAYLFSQTALFWNIVKSRVRLQDKVLFVLFFAGISILGTYLGIRLDGGAIANIRPVGAIVAGLIGGPWLGGAVGLISGLHRWSIGGFTAFACGVATIAEGLAGGWVGLKAKKNFLDLRWALLAGILGEVLQVGFVLLLAKPFEEAYAVERMVAIPMIVVNTVGVVGFVMVIRDVFTKHNGMIISQFNRFVEIERQMSAAIQDGLGEVSGDVFLADLMQRTELRGILLLKNEALMSFKGDRHEAESMRQAWSELAQKTAQKVQINVGKGAVTYYCVPVQHAHMSDSLTIGVKLLGRNYYDRYYIEFTDGIAELMANQFHAQALLAIQDKMSLAQLKALKAQIHPHFLFNALSTISSYCRTDGLKARELILDLAHYFRKTIEVEADRTTIRNEMELIRAYLHIEEARLGDRLHIHLDIPESLMDSVIPTFILQPLVENAIKYGIAQLAEGGELRISVSETTEALRIQVSNTKAQLDSDDKGCGQALHNIQERLGILYGKRGIFELNCTDHKETIAMMLIPKGDTL
jgi:two-component system LytT family sensor kinase